MSDKDKYNALKSIFWDYKIELLPLEKVIKKDLLSFYKKLIEIRNNSRALKEGLLMFLYSNDDKGSFAFERSYGTEKFIIAFNTGKSEDVFEVPVDYKKVQYVELLN